MIYQPSSKLLALDTNDVECLSKLIMLKVKLSMCMLDLIGSNFNHLGCNLYTTSHQ